MGILALDDADRITDWQEKPKQPKSDLASMGVYVFSKKALRRSEVAGLPCIGLIHDELMWLCREQDAEEVGRLGARCMVEAGLEVCPNVPWEQDYEIVDRWPSKG